jgi:DNA-directed RNA polymerase specialized sigma24 family protein
LRDPARFKSWLSRIATSQASPYRQRAKQVVVMPLDLVHHVEDLDGAGQEVQIEEASLLKLALGEISAMYRACLILYVIEELQERQIADILQIKESDVGQYVSWSLRGAAPEVSPAQR